MLRISKDSMPPGLNNLTTYTLLDEECSCRFGFSAKEIKSLFQRSHLSIDFEQVKNWYNGYKVGNLVMYNPLVDHLLYLYIGTF